MNIGVLLTFLIVVSMLRELARDVLRPWLARRRLREADERHEHDAWIKAMYEADQ